MLDVIEPLAGKVVVHALDINRQVLEIALTSPASLLEFPDNLDGTITSPELFRTYCVPFLQESAAAVHARGRFLGSHMDGDMKPLLDLVPGSGVDVVESCRQTEPELLCVDPGHWVRCCLAQGDTEGSPPA